MQRTTQNWASIDKAINGVILQQQLDIAIINQRAFFKVRRLRGKTRMEVFPQINSNIRKYTNEIEYEQQIFSLQKVFQALAKWQFVRILSKSGQFSLYKQVYYLDYKRAKTYVMIKFNIKNIEWDITDTNGNHLKSIKIKNFDLENILNLTICQKTKKK